MEVQTRDDLDSHFFVAAHLDAQPTLLMLPAPSVFPEA